MSTATITQLKGYTFRIFPTKQQAEFFHKNFGCARMYSATEIADYVVAYCDNLGKPVSNLKLQKLLFFIQTGYYTENRTWLFDDDFQAWQYGPVIPAVYHRYSSWAGMNIRCGAGADVKQDCQIDNSARACIERCVNKRIDMSGWALVAEMHEDGSPWNRVYRGGTGLRNVIRKELIADYALIRG